MGCCAIPALSISIVFLDVDGVLNSMETNMCGIDKVHMNHLKFIVSNTTHECKLILSTSWRTDEKLKQTLLDTLESELGIDNINDFVIGQTPYLVKQRAIEIDQYFITNKKMLSKKYMIESWIALDDTNIDGPTKECQTIMEGHFVKVDPEYGLTWDDAKLAIKMLNGSESHL
eukprot:224521_1